MPEAHLRNLPGETSGHSRAWWNSSLYTGRTSGRHRALPGTRRYQRCVIPWTMSRLWDASDSELDQYPGLADWWRRAEAIWEAERSASTRLSLREQLDYYGKLSGQFPLQRHRVLYTKSGNRITACRIDDEHAIVDHTLYWAAVDSIDEARYLQTILNSDAVHAIIEPLMSEGLFGKRHIDKYVFAARFPIYDPESELHRQLARIGARAEQVASEVDVSNVRSFQAARRGIRDALASSVGEKLTTLSPPSSALDPAAGARRTPTPNPYDGVADQTQSHADRRSRGRCRRLGRGEGVLPGGESGRRGLVRARVEDRASLADVLLLLGSRRTERAAGRDHAAG